MFRKLLIIVFFVSIHSIAQEHALVYFTDKSNVANALANPITILTQEAIDRKAMHGVAIDERDVPLNNTYVLAVQATLDIEVKARLRWMNAVHVVGTQAAILGLLGQSYVADVYFFDRSLNPSSRNATINVEGLHYNKLEVQTTFNYGNAATQVSMLNVDKLHEAGFTGSGMVVAVMDSGFPNVDTMGAFQQMRDNGNLLGGYDFVTRSIDIYNAGLNFHGTWVLSDMSAFVQDQFVGTAPDASYYLFRTEDAGSETPAEESYWIEAAARADSLGVDVINTSLGYNTFDEAKYNYTTAEMDGMTAVISQGANIATEKGVLVVNSAGNSGGGSWNIITAPADANVLTVGAVTATGVTASFSSRGPTADGRVKPDVMAMGAAAAIVNQNNVLGTANGTSFSSPIMAGAVSCLWQASPAMTNLEMMQLLREMSSLFATPNNEMGYGIPNFELALNVLDIDDADPLDMVAIFPNPTKDFLNLQLPFGQSNVQFQLFNILGKKVLDRTLSSGTHRIDISKMSRGIYLASFKVEETQQTFKIIKE